LKGEIWQKRRTSKEDMIELREILILVMFVNIKEVHPRGRNLKKLNINIRKRETLIEEIENRKEKKKKEIEDLKRENYA
jgi:hypothetical protein